MADKNTIKSWFLTGLKPTQVQFWATWDSFWHKDEKIPITAIDDIENILAEKADTEALGNHLMDEAAHATLFDAKANQSNLDAETVNRAMADSALRIDLQSEEASRIQGDLDLSMEIDNKIAAIDLTVKVDKVDGERLINAGEITKLENQSGVNTGDQDLSGFYTKVEVDSKVSSVYKFMGNVANYASLPIVGMEVGNVYNLFDTGENYAWTGTVWDNLGTTIDVSGKENTSNKQNSLVFDGTGIKYVTIDAANAGLALKSPLNSPIFTGLPTAPTATPGSNTTQLANTKFVAILDLENVKMNTNQIIMGVKTFTSMPILNEVTGSLNGLIIYSDNTGKLKALPNFRYDDVTGLLTTKIGVLGSNAYSSTPYLPLTGGNLSGNISASNLISGVFPTTATAIINATINSSSNLFYTRVGNIVTVQGSVNASYIDQTSLFTIGIPLPIASNLTGSPHTIGSGSVIFYADSIDDNYIPDGIIVVSDQVNNMAIIKVVQAYNPPFAEISFNFTYEIK